MRVGGQSSPLLSHLLTDWCMISVLITANMARGCRWSRNLKPNFCPGRDLKSEPLDCLVQHTNHHRAPPYIAQFNSKAISRLLHRVMEYKAWFDRHLHGDKESLDWFKIYKIIQNKLLQ